MQIMDGACVDYLIFKLLYLFTGNYLIKLLTYFAYVFKVIPHIVYEA